MRKIALALAAFAAAALLLDRRVDVMGYDVPVPSRAGRVSSLQFVNDVNRATASKANRPATVCQSTATSAGIQWLCTNSASRR